MKSRLRVLLSAGSAMILSCTAQAVLTGLVVTQEPPPPFIPPPTGGPRTIYHVFAEFDNPSDRVNVWGGGGELGSGIIQNVLADGITLGTGFTQIGGAGGQLAPYEDRFRLWDTYMTIGVSDGTEAPGGNDATTQIPGTPIFISGTTWTAPFNGGGVFITPDDIQGRADYRVIGNDTNLRVLLMNLVVNQGQHVQGTIGVAWGVDGVYGSGVVTSGLTFSSIPAPGAWVLLCSGLVGVHRRRSGGMS